MPQPSVHDLLQSRLSDAIDIAAQIKQAHWNVRGPNFIGLHRLFDELNDEFTGYADLLAERLVALGGSAMGTVQETAARSGIDKYPENATVGEDHIAALTAAFSTFSTALKADVLAAEAAEDPATADLFTEVLRGVDQSRWLASAHQH